ncbi:MAG: glycosyltransferase family 2 protein [bacterium]|nr:glycosyltransferase family 2 protein [bacterium]
MDTVKISIIILNYKTKHLLRLVIKNLQDLNITLPYEIIVIDNASQDGSVEMVEELYPNIKLIVNPKNTGHAHGNNLGIAQAKGEYLLIMNSDIIFSKPSDIMKMIMYLDEHQNVGLLGPQLRNGDGTIQKSCFRPYGRFTPIYRRTPLGKFGPAQRDLDRHLMSDFDHNSLREVDWILGACIFVRKSAIEKVGSFNEKFFLYFADFELCDRLRNSDYKVIYYPDVEIVHYHKRESAQSSIWGGLGSLLNYVTRVHLNDWITYKKISNNKS